MKCAVGPCQALRLPGSDYCAKHGPYVNGHPVGHRSLYQRLDAVGDKYIEQDKHIVCPYCHESSCVTTRTKSVKRGLSGGKAAAAILTGGFTVGLFGLSRKQEVTELTCSNCGMKWTVDD